MTSRSSTMQGSDTNAEPRGLVQAVKRNAARFPPDSMFRLTLVQAASLKSQTVISSWGG
jgi:hypothetical protein